MTMRSVLFVALFGVLCSTIFALAQTSPVAFRQLAELTASDGETEDSLGYSVAISGNTIVAGAPQGEPQGRSGKAYVFVEPATGWADATQTAELSPSGRLPNLWFGSSVAVSGDTVVVDGQSFQDSGTQPQAYVFVKPAGGWRNMTESARIVFPGLDFYTVAIAGNTIVAFGVSSSSGQDALYVFEKPKRGWSGTLMPKAVLTCTRNLGVALAFDGTTIVSGSDGGEGACVFTKPPSGWVNGTQTADLSAFPFNGSSEFGCSVAISGSTIVVGAYNTGDFVGTAYLFYEPATGWTTTTQSAEIPAPNNQSNGIFAGSVAVSGSLVAVGAVGDTVDGNVNEGAVWAFDGTTQLAELTPSENLAGENVGSSVAMEGSTLATGAVGAAVGSNLGQGKIYVFGR
jgi:hypothetical protein